MRRYPFTQCDVFSDESLRGNPVAVIHAANDWTDEQMAAMARWTNLSETTFLLPPTHPDADYRLRIFTPGRELPFAGHPTLGSAAAWLAVGGVPHQPGRIIQECGIGLVSLKVIRHDETSPWRIAFQAPLSEREPIDNTLLQQAQAALGVHAEQVLGACWLRNGPEFLTLRLRDADTVLSLQPDHAAIKKMDVFVGAVGAHDPQHLEVRAFIAADGIEEDPITGSLQAAIAQWFYGEGWMQGPYLSTQGSAIQRSGKVYVEQLDGQVWIAGDVRVCVQGQLTL